MLASYPDNCQSRNERSRHQRTDRLRGAGVFAILAGTFTACSVDDTPNPEYCTVQRSYAETILSPCAHETRPAGDPDNEVQFSANLNADPKYDQLLVTFRKQVHGGTFDLIDVSPTNLRITINADIVGAPGNTTVTTQYQGFRGTVEVSSVEGRFRAALHDVEFSQR